MSNRIPPDWSVLADLRAATWAGVRACHLWIEDSQIRGEIPDQVLQGFPDPGRNRPPLFGPDIVPQEIAAPPPPDAMIAAGEPEPGQGNGAQNREPCNGQDDRALTRLLLLLLLLALSACGAYIAAFGAAVSLAAVLPWRRP